jgi:hypothetical protein
MIEPATTNVDARTSPSGFSVCRFRLAMWTPRHLTIRGGSPTPGRLQHVPPPPTSAAAGQPVYRPVRLGAALVTFSECEGDFSHWRAVRRGHTLVSGTHAYAPGRSDHVNSWEHPLDVEPDGRHSAKPILPKKRLVLRLPHRSAGAHPRYLRPATTPGIAGRSLSLSKLEPFVHRQCLPRNESEVN